MIKPIYKLFNKPYKLAFGFVAVVLLYYFLGYLNYARAGKIALNGFLFIGLISSLLHVYPSKFLRYFAFFIITILFFNLQFHAFLRDIFGVSQEDIIVMQAIFETNTNEAHEFFLQYRSYILKHLLLLMVFLILYGKLFFNAQLQSTKKNMIAWSFFFIIIHLNPTMRRANPIVYFPYYYMKWEQNLKQLTNLEQTLNRQLQTSRWFVQSDTNHSQTVVWVIGESDTRYNWSLYGYPRQTTPKIASLIDQHMFVFDHATASAPATVSAFERMLTPADEQHPKEWQKFPDIVFLAKKAGFKTFWISNQVSDKTNTIAVFAHHADVFIETNKGRARGEGYYDDVVIKPYQKALHDPYPKKFIIVHLMGSHPAYDFRYPKSFGTFTYTFNDAVMQQLLKSGRSKWALVFRNLYDNTILHTDHVLAMLLQSLKDLNATEKVWIYHPDHGQDVCHHSNFSGHNYEVKEQWDVPLLIWHSNKQTTTDFIHIPFDLADMYYTLIGLLHLKTDLYQKDNDLFNKIKN